MDAEITKSVGKLNAVEYTKRDHGNDDRFIAKEPRPESSNTNDRWIEHSWSTLVMCAIKYVVAKAYNLPIELKFLNCTPLIRMCLTLKWAQSFPIVNAFNHHFLVCWIRIFPVPTPDYLLYIFIFCLGFKDHGSCNHWDGYVLGFSPPPFFCIIAKMDAKIQYNMPVFVRTTLFIITIGFIFHYCRCLCSENISKLPGQAFL